MRILKHLPNFITSLNILSGIFAIVAAFEITHQNHLVMAAYWIGMAALFDYLDGMVARLVRGTTMIGEQLDSLADMVSFGLAPGVILFHLMLKAHNLPELYITDTNVIPYIAFMVPVFSAFRLAKFNIDKRQSSSFIGLPTPASAILVASLPLIMYQIAINQSATYGFITALILNSNVLIILVVALSVLMVVEFPMFSLKFKTYTWKGNQIRYIFLLLSALFIVYFYFIAIPMIIFLYILFSAFSPASQR
ncbi:MAG: CDP-alcohol phosphatidyltransferase family protein [Bacteroidales bacterium]|nr:CDP-alcohol phosphatidyltransferase family protein [Bacteroidales bacterium]